MHKYSVTIAGRHETSFTVEKEFFDELKQIASARNEEGGQNISIRLEDNPSIYVKDFVTNENGDIIAYIMKSRSVKFIEVLAEIKSVLGLRNDWEPPKRDMLFGGFYDRIGEDRQVEIATYPESIMDQYVDKGNRQLAHTLPYSCSVRVTSSD